MPKTPVYKYHRFVAREHDVRVSRQLPLVESKAQTVTVEK